MNYEFPTIRLIEDIEPHIRDFSEFIIADKGDYIVANYLVDTGSTFDRNVPGWEYRRECRGLMFDRNGVIISRPFHKFANIGQWNETQLVNLDFNKTKAVWTKLDGSFIRPFMINGELLFGTKMGITETSEQATDVIRKKFPNVIDFSVECCKLGLTPIFEFTSPDNRIVIEYDDDGMTLLALRDNKAGIYYDINNADMIVGDYGVYVACQHNFKSADDIQKIAGMSGIEGFVWEFEGGHRAKIKTDEYVKLHRVFDSMTKERHIVVAILDNIIDDFIPSLDGKKLEFVQSVMDEFAHNLDSLTERLEQEIKIAHEEFDSDRKRIALEYIPTLDNKSDAKMIFNSFKDDFDLKDAIMVELKKGANRDVNWDETKIWMQGIQQ